MLLYEELSEKVIGAMINVHRTVGPGLAESLYEGALEIEIRELGLSYERQKPFRYNYKGKLAGYYISDMIIENKIILELKSVSQMNKAMEAQLFNYLRIAKLRVGFLVNFKNSRLVYKRFII